MPKFDKFLSRPPVSHPETEKPPLPRKRGRPPLPDHLRKYPKRKTERHGPDGRVLPHLRKIKQAGNRHPAAKRATKRRYYKRNYQKRLLAQAAWRQTLRRRYSQSRSYQRLCAAKRGQDPTWMWQLSYAEYLLMWETAPAVWVEDRFVTAKSLIGNPLTTTGATYMDRLDRTKPFTRDNCRVFRSGNPLA